MEEPKSSGAQCGQFSSRGTSSLPRVPPQLPPCNLFLLHAKKQIWPRILKQSKTLCKCPESGKAQMVCLGLLKGWPCCLIVPLYTRFQEGEIKATLCILLLRSGSCLPSPVSHSLIKSFILIQPVPKSLLAIKCFNLRILFTMTLIEGFIQT